MVQDNFNSGCNLDIWSMSDLMRVVQDFKNMKATSSELDRKNSFDNADQNGQDTPHDPMDLDQIQSPEHKTDHKILPTNAFIQSKEAHLAVRQMQSKNDMDDIFADLDLMMYKNVNSLFNIQPSGLPAPPSKSMTSAPVEVNLLDPFTQATPSQSKEAKASAPKIPETKSPISQAGGKTKVANEPQAKPVATPAHEVKPTVTKMSSNEPKSKVEVIK